MRERSFGGSVPFPYQPVVEQVASEAGKLQPIVTTTTLHIYGKQFQSQRTQVRMNGFEMTPASVTETQIILPLATLPVDCLRAGIQGLQVIHRIAASSTSGYYSDRAIESNAIPIVLRPTIKQIHITASGEQHDELRSALLTLQVDVMVGMKQRVVLVMNEWSIDNPVGYQFEANPRTSDTDTIAIALHIVKPAEYLLRLQIDGAESLLSVDTDPNSPTFNWYSGPKVRIED